MLAIFKWLHRTNSGEIQGLERDSSVRGEGLRHENGWGADGTDASPACIWQRNHCAVAARDQTMPSVQVVLGELKLEASRDTEGESAS